MFKTIFLIISIFSGLYLGYFLIFALGIFKKRKRKFINRDKNNFAVIIAARNEEEVIANLVDSLKKQNYPSENYKVYVIINNCTDNTESVAKQAGASIINCTCNVKSKGEVLKYTFEELKSDDSIDAYVIFDADNIVNKNFLNEMNNMLNQGYTVAQGFRDTKNLSDNWLSSSYAILYYLQSVFINKARYNLGKSSFLNGTGFMVKKEVIDKYGFDPITLTEDIEFTAMCAVNGEKIAFAEKAITYDEQVTHLMDSLKQRKRWSIGTMQCLRGYGWTLIKKGIKEKRIECFDILLFYLSLVFQVVTTITSFVTILFILFVFKKFDVFVSMHLIVPIVFYVIAVIFRMILIKSCGKSIKDNIGGILLFDFFLITWAPVNFICLFKKDCNWEQIKHNRNIDADDLEI